MKTEAEEPAQRILHPNGELVEFSLEYLEKYLDTLTYDLDLTFIDTHSIASKVGAGLYDKTELYTFENLVAETIAYMSTKHPDYRLLAGRYKIRSLYRMTRPLFSDVVNELYWHTNPIINAHAPLISEHVWRITQDHAERLDAAIVHDRDLAFDYFGYKTLEHSYLLKKHSKEIIERPQHLFMRVSLGIHMKDIDAAIETYNLLSLGFFIHASPSMFNAGTPNPQMSSCFLVQMKDDSIDGIYKTLHTTALISKTAGGLGISVHNIRATGSYISGTNGTSNGLVPMLRIFNDTARYVDQGGGKRKGAFAIYLEPWHADIKGFLELKNNTGKEEVRARDLFYALWTPDLLMERAEADKEWSLFCPHEAPGLEKVWGKAFKSLYINYEQERRARTTIKARELLVEIAKAQIETGAPFMLFKDACNRKSNQQNLGTIQSSNLCNEIVQYTSPDEVAVCNLASIALPKYVDMECQDINHQLLRSIVRVVTFNLNKIIDNNQYPTPQARNSNIKHRPMGIGVQGLADLFAMLKIAFDSDRARKINKDIFETIYFAALEASMELAKRDGPYESYQGSPVSQGILQYDMWSMAGELFEDINLVEGSRWDWAGLKEDIAKYGVRNSLLLAVMPTASTSQILGNNEYTEPFTSNIYSRRVLSGEFPIINKHLVKALSELGLWTEHMRDLIVYHKGSVQSIRAIPQEIRDVFRTVWEIKPSMLLQMNAERGVFIDQAQSMSLYVKHVTVRKMTSLYMKAWKMGLKNAIYYLRTEAAADAIQFTLNTHIIAQAQKMYDDSKIEEDIPQTESEKKSEEPLLCPIRRPGMPVDEECLACGS